MTKVALWFAAGESLYPGSALLLLAVAFASLKGLWLLRIRNLTAWVGLVFILMACPPYALSVDLSFLTVFVLWFVVSNRSSLSQISATVQKISALVLMVLLLSLPALEFPHRSLPKIAQNMSDHLVVIGDSISSGIDSHVEPWPIVLQKSCGLQVRNLSRPGAQVSDALLMARELSDGDHLVLLEIGGNDLLTGVSSAKYGKDLDELLATISAPKRTIIMFELPLLPNKVGYGRVQRRLSAKYHVTLIPKRYFTTVIRDGDATTDGLHLSASGSRRMAGLVADVLSLPLKSCPR